MNSSYLNAQNRNKTTRFLNGLADPVRLHILSLLGRKGRMNVGEIASNFHVSRPAISHHLRILKDADIVSYEKIGQEVYYWMDQEYVVSHLHNLANEMDSM
ncbi:metalloregulator ArsR/SmtB family transcription factor [Paenibacillus sp. WLX1005]|uniref:metalloregulator ArsR/SmtB family transcription factor n=1 Tax=unclassified Paenibacillus TaxID=185978 RepID=UPI003983E0F9